MALILVLLGFAGIAISIDLWFKDPDIQFILVLMVSLAFIVSPFIGNTSHIDKHFVVRSDSFQGVTYNKVVTIEYDVLKADYWWTWNNLLMNDIENIHISFEG